MRTSTRSILATSAATALFAGTAAAQTSATFLLTSSNTVSPSAPITTIEIWAMWADPNAEHAFAGADYNLTASDGEFSNPVNVLNGQSSTTGVINGNTITGGSNGQLVLCGFAGCTPIVNPILLATYEWTTADFAPRSVGLETSDTTVFQVAIPRSFGKTVLVDLYPQEFTPGSGVINVVPGPAAWYVVAVPLVAGTRRRRS